MKAKRKVTDKNWEFDGTTVRAPPKPRPRYRPHPDDLETPRWPKGHHRPRRQRRIGGGGRSIRARSRSATDIAAHEKITDSFAARMLCLTLLAPDITEAILKGRQPKGLKLATLLCGVPAWNEQQRVLGFASGVHA
jgi:hypothetical protein